MKHEVVLEDGRQRFKKAYVLEKLSQLKLDIVLLNNSITLFFVVIHFYRIRQHIETKI
jgi:hypothetical protein